MAPISVGQTSFTGGEVSPSLYGRTKLAQYYKSVRTMLNFIVHPHGPTSNRPGTKFIAETKDSSKLSRLIPFTFSVTQTYMLEFGNEYMRVYKDGAPVVEGDKAITGATQLNPIEITSAGHGYANGDWIIISGVTGMTELNGKTFVVANAGVTFTLKDVDGNAIDGTSGYSAYTGGGVANRIYEIATTYLEADLALLKYEQSADVLYINHPGYVERQITRTGHTAWSIGDTTFGATLAAPTTFANDGGGPGRTRVITAATQADPVVITSVGHGYVNGDYVLISGVVGMTEINNKIFLIDNATVDTFSLKYGPDQHDVDGTGYAAYTSGGIARILTLNTYGVTAVSADGSESLLSTPATGTVGDVLTWDVRAGADYYNFYQLNNGVYGWLGYAGTNTFTVPELLNPDMEAAPPTLGNYFAGADNYPGVSAFHEQRLIRARTNNAPQTFRGSVTGDFDNMNSSSPLREDDAYNFTLNSNAVNEIRWLVSLKALIIGTSESIWQALPGYGEAITAYSIKVDKQNTMGVADVLPIPIGNSILFISYSGERVYDLFYSFEDDGYKGNDLSVLASHLFKDDSLIDWCFQRHPDSTLWCVKKGGGLLGLTYFREHEVWGWHRHETDGAFESTARISTSEGVDEVYFIVNRTIDGSTRRYVEKLEERLPNNAIEDAFFVDCGLSYSGPPVVTIISGLDHLEGEDVAVLADGLVIAGHTVSGGKITLDVAATKVHVGLAYISDLETLDFEFPVEGGNTVLDKQRDVVSVLLRLENTSALLIGPDADNLEEIAFTAGELFDGDKETVITAGELREDRVFIRNTDPVPVTINAIIARVDYGEL